MTAVYSSFLQRRQRLSLAAEPPLALALADLCPAVILAAGHVVDARTTIADIPVDRGSDSRWRRQLPARVSD